MATVFLHGQFMDARDAQISAFDAGFQHGVGLFETMLAVASRDGSRPRVLHLWEHLERLRQSAFDLGLASSIHTDALGEAIERTCVKEAERSPDTQRFRIRVTLSGGDLNLLARRMTASPTGEPPAPHEPTLMIHVQPASSYPAEMFERGVRALVADMKANPFDPGQGHKTLNYWSRLTELQRAAAKGAGESLVFQLTNHLAGGCVSNAFIVKDGALYTPIARGEESEVAGGESDPSRPEPQQGPLTLPSPVLPGITRRWVLDWALASGLAAQRRMISIRDVLAADEVFLTNSSWGVLPVVAVEAEQIAAGAPGEVTGRVMSAWNELAAGDDGSL